MLLLIVIFFFFSSRRRHTILTCDWSSDVCSSDLERESGQPIPLGGIVAWRYLGAERVAAIDRALRASVEYALAHRAEAAAYIRAHSQEMSDEVCAAHIDLYVNRYSVDLGAEGEAAVTTLFGRAEAAGLIPSSAKHLFRP